MKLYKRIAEQVGTPCYVYDAEKLREQVLQLRSALDRYYPNSKIYYSVKTNPLPAIVSDAARYGAFPEVIAGYEIEHVAALGLFGSDSVVNGPLKRESELTAAIDAGALINIDNQEEIGRVKRVAQRMRKTARVGVRINAQIGDLPWTRFGFGYESGEALTAVGAVLGKRFLNLQCVQLHIGTNVQDPSSYRMASQVLRDFLLDIEHTYEHRVPMIDIGGGYPTEIRPRDVAPSDWSPSSIDEYVRAIALGFEGYSYSLPRLLMEPGRYLVDDAVKVLSRVEAVRGATGEEIVIDAGINVLPSTRYREHRIELLDGRGVKRRVRVVGPTCMGHDIPFEECVMPSPKAGDLLLISHGGAYSISMSYPFIRALPPVVRVSNGSATLVRRRQTVGDIFCCDLDTPLEVPVERSVPLGLAD